jgi:L-2-hydroxyglutarate oxidase LhgO
MDSAPEVDVVVIGAGVVGLAVAARLAGAGRSVIVLERREGPGRETSSRNSEVIHAGIYYPPGSLRARLCVRGNRLLYAFCEASGVACRALGKLVVACSDDEVSSLEELWRRGTTNGARELRLLEAQEARRLEPNVHARAALLSPSTGILDTHGLLKALEARARGHGAQLLYRCRVVAVDRRGEGYTVSVENPSGEERLAARVVVNAAGLESDRVAALAGVDRYRLHPCKGDYFAVSARRAKLVSRLIYPLPTTELQGLGIHVTLDLGGRMRLGPDATYVTRDADGVLDVDPNKAHTFWTAARRYLPALELEDLQPDMAGIRPKLQGPDDPWQDFVITDEQEAGLPGLVSLVGIDSPGLTAALAIAELVEAISKHYI